MFIKNLKSELPEKCLKKTTMDAGCCRWYITLCLLCSAWSEWIVFLTRLKFAGNVMYSISLQIIANSCPVVNGVVDSLGTNTDTIIETFFNNIPETTGPASVLFNLEQGPLYP